MTDNLNLKCVVDQIESLRLAALIVIGEIVEAVEQVKEEMIDLAQTQIDQLEG